MMRYYRRYLVGGEYVYARTQGVDRADRCYPSDPGWVRDDELEAEIQFTGNWAPASAEEAEAAAAVAAARAQSAVAA